MYSTECHTINKTSAKQAGGCVSRHMYWSICHTQTSLLLLGSVMHYIEIVKKMVGDTFATAIKFLFVLVSGDKLNWKVDKE